MSRLAVIGLTARDRVDGREASTGGAPLYCLEALDQAGTSAHIITKLAAPDALLLKPLHDLSDHVAWRPASETAEYILSYDPKYSQRTLSVSTLGEPWRSDELKRWVLPALAGCELVHAGALNASDFSADTLAVLSEHHRLSLDGQGLVRPARKGPVTLEHPDSLELLKHVSVLKLSEEEAAVLGVEPAAESMAALRVPELVLTMGDRGALILAGGAVVEIRAELVTAHETTGTGDGFIACYLHARLSGASASDAGTFAARAVAAMLRRRNARN